MDKLNLKNQSIWVTGHTGMVGAAVTRYLTKLGCQRILTASHSQIDLTSKEMTFNWLDKNRPDIIFHCAGMVGGIEANRNNPIEFFNENLAMGLNVVNGAAEYGVKKFINLGTSCMYPTTSPSPKKEETILTGPFEITNEGYALAKVSIMKLCSYYNSQRGLDFITLIPTNLYGTGDDYNPQTSHVISALIHKFMQAVLLELPEVSIWGTGKAERQFLHVDDAARAIVELALTYSKNTPINIAGENPITIKKLVHLIKRITNYHGEIVFDQSKPDGMLKKYLSTDTLNTVTSWTPQISLSQGITKSVSEYKMEIKYEL